MKPGDFVEARRRLEAKPRTSGEKITTLTDAVGRVKDGDHVAIGGCLFSQTPLALLRELLRQRRRFVPKVDFVTSPGFLDGGDSRRKSGLIFGRISRIVTNLGIMGFDDQTKVVRLERLNPGVSVQEVAENTGVDLLIPERIPVAEPPRESELGLLRSLDPDRNFLRADGSPAVSIRKDNKPD